MNTTNIDRAVEAGCTIEIEAGTSAWIIASGERMTAFLMSREGRSIAAGCGRTIADAIERLDAKIGGVESTIAAFAAGAAK